MTNYDKEDPIGIFEDNVNKNLIAISEAGRNQYVKIRHPRFAEEIIEDRIGTESDVGGKIVAENLSTLLREFIKYSKQNIMYDLDSTIDILKKFCLSLGTQTV